MIEETKKTANKTLSFSHVATKSQKFFKNFDKKTCPLYSNRLQ